MKYFKKLAKKEKPKVESTLLSTYAGTAGGTLLSKGIVSSLVDVESLLGPQTPKLDKNVKDLAKKFKKKHNLKTKIHTGSKAHPMTEKAGPFFAPKWMKAGVEPGVHIRHGSKPEILLHELGHAKDFEKLPKLKSALRVIGPLGGLAGATVLSKDEKKRKYAPAAAAAGTAPVLWQEGKADYHALKFLKEEKGTKAALKGAKSLGKAFGTYLTLPVGAAAGVWGINKLIHKNNKQKKGK